MRTQTFTGATSREVLQKVRQALGDDALILSNRACEGGMIEVVALAASALNVAVPAAAPPPAIEPLRAATPAQIAMHSQAHAFAQAQAQLESPLHHAAAAYAMALVRE